MRRFLPFALALAIFQNVVAVAGDTGTWIDLATPVAVLGTAYWALREGPRQAIRVGLIGGAVYAHGHGIHLAANDIRHFGLTGDAETRAYFWDEHWGHLEWHLGMLGLFAALALTDVPRVDVVSAVLIGFTWFTNSVEGQDWQLALASAVFFAAFAVARPTPARRTFAYATLLTAALIGGWAAWHGGVPQFSELGWF
jgi:hypothetical protein